ncbi:MAG: hypothetical protein H6720_25015 [Sandaracinus sp.]|nr:hypothetical protein [Sandaracinus sp.]MCB9622047.1 hypothetical protein [Sandaracinus sp.]
MVASRFAVATFDRVFDATPKRDVIDLATLVRGLVTFILKPELAKTVARDLEQLDRALASIEAGTRLGGRRYGRLARAEKEGGLEAARKEHERLRAKAKARAKMDLRLWSPAHFREGARRESTDVQHVSCLVLDYDSGAPIEESTAHWRGCFHVVHSTWSYTHEHPKYRLVLPLARPVMADDWRRFWDWGAARAGMRNDPALKSPASTFALPATPAREAPRIALVRAGRLFDPLESGLPLRTDVVPDEVPPPGPTHFRGDPDEKTLDEHPDGYVRDALEATRSLREDDFDLFSSNERVGENDFELFGTSEAKETEPAVEDPWEDEFDDMF